MKIRVRLAAGVTLQIETIRPGDPARPIDAPDVGSDPLVELRVIEDDGDNVATLLTGEQSLAASEALKLAAVEIGAMRPALSQVIE